ncbi:MAG: hypothetical protein U0822_13345 [Anaerolineae bacterium]
MTMSEEERTPNESDATPQGSAEGTPESEEGGLLDSLNQRSTPQPELGGANEPNESEGDWRRRPATGRPGVPVISAEEAEEPGAPSAPPRPAEFTEMTGVTEEALEEGVEPDKPDLRPFYIFLAALVVLGALAFGIASAMTWLVTGFPPAWGPPEQMILDVPPLVPTPVAPTLQGQPLEDWLAYKAKTDALLYDSPSWVDKNQGIVRIPIDQAMAAVLKQGLPTRPGAQKLEFGTYGSLYPQMSSSGRQATPPAR